MTICELAKSKLGTDFTDDKLVPDEVSCAFAVTTILQELEPRIPIIYHTKTLLDFLLQSDLFERVYEPEAGDIVICATGTNSRPDIISNGHAGIYADQVNIMSNDSNTGLWKINFTRETWRQRYYYRGGFSVYLFRKVV